MTAAHLLGGIFVPDRGPDGVSLLKELLGQLCAQGWQALDRQTSSRQAIQTMSDLPRRAASTAECQAVP